MRIFHLLTLNITHYILNHTLLLILYGGSIYTPEIHIKVSDPIQNLYGIDIRPLLTILRGNFFHFLTVEMIDEMSK